MAPKNILAWDDDPASVDGHRPEPRAPAILGKMPLPVRISGTAPQPGEYGTDTAEFRHWAAADALARAVLYWQPLVPKRTKWQTGSPLPVHLDAGVDLNAYYARGGYGYDAGLSFFHDVVAGRSVYSGESPDIVTHELGHAMLDAIRPELWDTATIEAAALHESFGDISAVVSGLQLPSLREAVLRDTGHRVYRSSRVSRLAEQMGWAVRHFDPASAEPDCLRNAVNSFFYRDPETLPPTAPVTLLSSEPHSFSRVFTAAFVEMLAGMFIVAGEKNGEEKELLEASRDAGQILVEAILAAPIIPDYFRSIAAYCVKADEKRYRKKYRDVVQGAFVRRGILPLDSRAKPLTRRKVGRCVIRRRRYGISEPVVVMAPDVRAAECFFEDLVCRGRLDLGAAAGNADAMVWQPYIRKTHILVRENGELVLRRRMFD
ncbi:MAG TPA: hypothetical protein VM779_01310 [Thermoanaerobaculia bacterium]|nr:hypothetical protein [Thermoanaerobaculia bacterium]